MKNPFFYKGSEDVLVKITKDTDKDSPAEKIRESFTKILDGKNLSFLLGSGCSSLIIEGEKGPSEIGIPTMQHLATDFYANALKQDDKDWLKKELKLDVEQDEFKKNLEKLLGTLHSIYFFFETTGQIPPKPTPTDEGAETAVKPLTLQDPTVKSTPERVGEIIRLARNFLLEKCLNESRSIKKEDVELIELYKAFYRKLLYRSSNLRKPNIFTTNYDLYSEIALDKLGIHYVNGFYGGIKKYFNPTIFNYALAEKMDLSHEKWNVIDNFVYLYKLHGSVNWIHDEEENKLFRVRESSAIGYAQLKDQDVIMVHPTPLKQNASLGSPYSDLFREFQKRLMQNNNVLVTLGYSFGDEHVNHLIYQAFTIPSFRLIVFGDPTSNDTFKKLQQLNDPRIWIIGGPTEDGGKLHYFKGFVDNVLPDLSNDLMDETMESTLKKLFSPGT